MFSPSVLDWVPWKQTARWRVACRNFTRESSEKYLSKKKVRKAELREGKAEYTAVLNETSDNSTRSCGAVMVLLNCPKYKKEGQAL